MKRLHRLQNQGFHHIFKSIQLFIIHLDAHKFYPICVMFIVKILVFLSKKSASQPAVFLLNSRQEQKKRSRNKQNGFSVLTNWGASISETFTKFVALIHCCITFSTTILLAMKFSKAFTNHAILTGKLQIQSSDGVRDFS